MKHTLSLNKNTLFRRLYYRGKAYKCPYFVMYVLKTNARPNRVGFTVSKKIGKAVARNRARRLMYESFRLFEDRINQGYYIVMVARASILNVKFATLKDTLYDILDKANMLRK